MRTIAYINESNAWAHGAFLRALAVKTPYIMGISTVSRFVGNMLGLRK